jgi:two-component system cell cycle response regulator CpdR
MGKRTVLFVDDEQKILSSLERGLLNEPYNKLFSRSGIQALEILQREEVHVIVVDMRMPEMNGIELARRAAEFDPDLKIMFITGFAAVALNQDSQTPKDAKVLSKPFHLRDLVKEIERLILD